MPSNRPRVLYVDDDEDSRFMLTTLLKLVLIDMFAGFKVARHRWL